MITKDDFDAWRDNEVTQAVFRAIELEIEKAQEMWLARSWGDGIADERLLIAVRERASVARDLIDYDFDDLENSLEQLEGSNHQPRA